MRIVQAVFGVFQHFELARELRKRQALTRIYSTYPWQRLRREGLPPEIVETFPFLHMAELAADRLLGGFPAVADQLGVWNAQAFDRWTAKRVPPCDAFIGLSGAGLATGKLVQQRGGVFVCDRGSTHQRYQERVVREEFERWGATRRVSDPRDTAREEAIYEAADAITVPSTLAKRSFTGMGIPADKVHVIPYGVRLESFHPVAEPAEGSFDVLFAGAVGLRKGVPYLLQAFADVKHAGKCLRIAGQMQPEFKSVLERLPRSRVEFLGPVSKSRLRDLMSRAHVLVLPSVEEGLALVQAEAMACGCPILCSDATGGEDLFTDGVEGFIVPVRGVEELRDRMQRLADHPQLQRTMRAATLARVQSIGGWAEYGDRWVALLNRLTGLPD